MTVVYFGPLTCSIITTTRKFFTILASVILFANPISSMQWVGTVLVFLGEFYPEQEPAGVTGEAAETYRVISEKTFLKEKGRKPSL